MTRHWEAVGLKEAEYQLIVSKLGREPNEVELGMFGVLWSEHCAYKHSKETLRSLPTRSSRVIVGPGENAGVLDIGDGLAVCFKAESHNHPCAVEPFQGAATGVGGIIRDILAMGARPIALLDSLRFGPLDQPRSRYLFSGVVAGIASYGNCVGIPTVGGEVAFEDAYLDNPLCNVMCVGLLRSNNVARGVTGKPGNATILVGSRTGRDGIHGASFASEELADNSHTRRPSVQVGDPFTGKLLIEACLEMLSLGLVVGIQDMGAAGITSSTAEMAARSGTGITLNLDLVPLRETGMTPYEIMISESQERMLVVAEKGKEEKVLEIARKWGLNAAVIGEVTADGMLRVTKGGSLVAEVPAALLSGGAPTYHPQSRIPDYLEEALKVDIHSFACPDDLQEVLLTMLGNPNIASKRWVYRQYDYMVRTNTVVVPGSDAAVMRIKLTEKGIALKMDGNGRYCYLDPWRGGAIAVAEAARNVACTGAQPIGLTNCLNFGNPEKEEIFWQFKGVVQGMADACKVLDIPVTGGNVSFYNETRGRAVLPTPVIGMVGLIDNIERTCTSGFKSPKDVIVLLGRNLEEAGGSEYLKMRAGKIAGNAPSIDLQAEKNLQAALIELISLGIISSAHDCSDGGIGVALAECCIHGLPEAQGAAIFFPDEIRPDVLLFGESQSRVIVSLPERRLGELEVIANKWSVPWSVIGSVAHDTLSVSTRTLRDERPLINLPVSKLTEAWEGSIPALLGK